MLFIREADRNIFGNYLLNKLRRVDFHLHKNNWHTSLPG